MLLVEGRSVAGAPLAATMEFDIDTSSLLEAALQSLGWMREIICHSQPEP
jgi:hypothetical protein